MKGAEAPFVVHEECLYFILPATTVNAARTDLERLMTSAASLREKRRLV